MKFKSTLIEGVFLKRYKRFFADIEYVDQKTGQKLALTIHVPNTGSLKSVLDPSGQPQKCWFTLSDDPNRKLKGTLEALQTPEKIWVGVNTGHPNKIVQEAAVESISSQKAFFKQWQGFNFYKPEFKISKETRLDGVFCHAEADLKDEQIKKYFIEIKNTSLVTMIDGEKHAQFPDAVTERGQKHLIELTALIEQGHQAELIFTIQRDDAEYFSVAEQIDSKYAALFKKAQLAGLKMTPVIVKINQSEVELTNNVLKIK